MKRFQQLARGQSAASDSDSDSNSDDDGAVQEILCAWMWADAGSPLGLDFAKKLAEINPLRWSSLGPPARIASELRRCSVQEAERPVRLRVGAEIQQFDAGPSAAVEWLEKTFCGDIDAAGAELAEEIRVFDSEKFRRVYFSRCEQGGPRGSHFVEPGSVDGEAWRDDFTDETRQAAYQTAVSLLMDARLGNTVRDHSAVANIQSLPRDLGVEEVWENEQRLPAGKFKPASTPSVLGREQWTDRAGVACSGLDGVSLPPGDAGIPWRWITEWEVDSDSGLTDIDGWLYASSFKAIIKDWRRSNEKATMVRKRRWVRVRQRGERTAAETAGNTLDRDVRNVVLATRLGGPNTDSPADRIPRARQHGLTSAEAQNLTKDEIYRARYAKSRGMLDSPFDPANIPTWD
jgi:hypothetical protein